MDPGEEPPPPPTAESGRAESLPELADAHVLQRLANVALDSGVAYGALLAVLTVAVPAPEGPPPGDGPEFTLFTLVFGLGFAWPTWSVLMVVYYLPQELLGGRTIAKWVTRTRTVRTDGARPTWTDGLKRALCRAIPFEGLSFLVGGTRPRGLHDRLSGTRVVTLTRRRADIAPRERKTEPRSAREELDPEDAVDTEADRLARWLR